MSSLIHTPGTRGSLFVVGMSTPLNVTYRGLVPSLWTTLDGAPLADVHAFDGVDGHRYLVEGDGAARRNFRPFDATEAEAEADRLEAAASPAIDGGPIGLSLALGDQVESLADGEPLVGLVVAVGAEGVTVSHDQGTTEGDAWTMGLVWHHTGAPRVPASIAARIGDDTAPALTREDLDRVPAGVRLPASRLTTHAALGLRTEARPGAYADPTVGTITGASSQGLVVTEADGQNYVVHPRALVVITDAPRAFTSARYAVRTESLEGSDSGRTGTVDPMWSATLPAREAVARLESLGVPAFTIGALFEAARNAAGSGRPVCLPDATVGLRVWAEARPLV